VLHYTGVNIKIKGSNPTAVINKYWRNGKSLKQQVIEVTSHQILMGIFMFTPELQSLACWLTQL
jgi:hypothetical protein